MLAKRFQQYDFGEAKNQELYGQPNPPEYDLSVIKDFPIAIIGGTTDRLTSAGDYKPLRDRMSEQNSCVFFKEYPYGHLGFLIPPT